MSQKSDRKFMERVSKMLKDFQLIMTEFLEELAQRKSNSISTGYKELDESLGGFKPGELIIIAGRPGMGKTTFAINLIKNMCYANKRVAMFSLEMSESSLASKIVSFESNVLLKKILNHKLDSKDWEKVSFSTPKFKKYNLLIDDSSYVNVSTIEEEISKIENIDIIFVDYLQLIVSDALIGANRVLEVAKITRNLRAIAKGRNIPIVVLSQLSRANESRVDKRPMLSDLRDSGSIEQDADKVLFLYRPGYYSEKEDPNECELIIAKNRCGDTGTINLKWEGEYSLFKEEEEYKDYDFVF